MLYRMPAEFEPHEATWIAWPHNQSHWPGKFDPIPPIFAKLAQILAKSEKVYVCVNDMKMESTARSFIGDEKNVRYFHIPTNASWARDHGPIFVWDREKKITVTDWIFNCWGEKYPPWDLDDRVPQQIAHELKLPMVQPGIVLEGGSIDVNGKGTLLTTRQCLLNKNRNPHLTQKQIEDYLEEYLGAANVLWLEEGIVGDDTDGHIDDIARFVDETTVVAPVEENPKDPNYKILQKNFEDLQQMKDQDGRPLKIVSIPSPDPVIYEGQMLPASYANFLIANSVVIMPTFQCSKDEKALQILQQLFPTRKVVGIDAVDWIWGLGTVHCNTQQMPALGR